MHKWKMVAGTAGAMLLGATLAVAPSAFASTATIKACVKTSSSAVRIVASGKCAAGEHLVTWNQTGASGANGAKGAAGANGTNGANGTAGATGPAGPAGVAGPTGAAGATGTIGADGKSAYDIWKAQPGNGAKLASDFLDSQTSYGVWKAQTGNGTKTMNDYLDSLTAYGIWKAQPGNGAKYPADFLESQTAFGIWKSQPGNSAKLVSDFLASLVRVSSATGIIAKGSSTASVICPAGGRAVGGGYSLSSTEAVNLVSSQPLVSSPPASSDATTWVFGFSGPLLIGGGILSVICLNTGA